MAPSDERINDSAKKQVLPANGGRGAGNGGSNSTIERDTLSAPNLPIRGLAKWIRTDYGSGTRWDILLRTLVPRGCQKTRRNLIYE